MPEGDQRNPNHTDSEAQETYVPKSNLVQLIEQVLALLEPQLESEGYELLDVRIFQGGGRFQVRIYVDLSEGGISLDRCTQAARTIGMLLEEADLFPGQYVIEVSSPGIRRPLRKAEHFLAAVGKKVELKLHPGGVQGRVRGTVTGVEDSTVMVQPPQQAGVEGEAEIMAIELAQIAEGNLDPDFDAKAIINADRRRKKEERRTERQEKSRQKRKKSRPKAGKTPPGLKGKKQAAPDQTDPGQLDVTDESSSDPSAED